jgi:hypothetical protein
MRKVIRLWSFMSLTGCREFGSRLFHMSFLEFLLEYLQSLQGANAQLLCRREFEMDLPANKSDRQTV